MIKTINTLSCFFQIFPFDLPKIHRNYSSLMFLEGSKGNIGKKWINKTSDNNDDKTYLNRLHKTLRNFVST